MSARPRSETDVAAPAQAVVRAEDRVPIADPVGGAPRDGSADEARDPAPADPPSHDPARHPMAWYLALAVLLVAVAALMLYLTRGLTFNLDEWIVVTERRGPGAPSLLAPHNEHLSVLLIGAFLALLRLGGLDDYALMMVPLIALQLCLGVLLFVIARARVGAGVAVGVAALALLTGLAYENFLIAGQAGQMASIVAGVAAFHVLDRPPGTRTDRLLCGLMIVALCSSGLGIPVLVGVGVELALTPAGRRRLWVVGVPFALYVVWYLAYGANRAGLHELAISALWAWTAMSLAAGALIGERQIEPGRDLLILLLLVLAYRTFRVAPASRVRLAAIATVLLTFYGLTAISRHDVAPPSSSRYLTVGLVFLLLMLVEAARGWRVRAWAPYVVLLFALLAFSKDSKLAFKEGRSLFLQRSERVRASLGAVDLLGRARVDPKLEIAPAAAPFLAGRRARVRGRHARARRRARARSGLPAAGELPARLAWDERPRARRRPARGGAAVGAADAARPALRRRVGRGRRAPRGARAGRGAAPACRRLAAAVRRAGAGRRTRLSPVARDGYDRVVAVAGGRRQRAATSLPSDRLSRPSSR
jgi:hypothetical protein